MTATLAVQRSVMTCRKVRDVTPGSPDWYAYMTASKIAAVVGHSPYTSYFALWHEMAGLIDPIPDNDTLRRGHYLEPAIADWFADQHPEWGVRPGFTGVHFMRRWQAATPDRIVQAGPWDTRLLEIKTANDDDWGDEGTDEIPPYYYDQVQWQLDTTGLDVAHVAVLSSFLEFREYVVEYDPHYAAELVTAADKFMRALAADERPSIDPLDGHMDTYRAVRELHTEINGETVELPADVATEYVAAYHEAKAAAKREKAAKNKAAEAMGDAKTGRYLGFKLINRQARKGGTPYPVAARTMPTAEQLNQQQEETE